MEEQEKTTQTKGGLGPQHGYTRAIFVPVTPEEHARFKVKVIASGRTIGDLCRELLADYIYPDKEGD